MANFVLIYDAISAAHLHEQLIAFVKANRNVTQWSQPFVGCMLLKSDAAPVLLQSSFGEFFAGKTPHLIAPFEASQTGGLLPQYLWNWLNQTQPSALSGLLGHLPSFEGAMKRS